MRKSLKLLVAITTVLFAVTFVTTSCKTSKEKEKDVVTNEKDEQDKKDEQDEKDEQDDNDEWMKDSPKPTEKVDVDFTQLTYTAFGDSITFGADYSKGYAQMDEPYPDLVGKELMLKSVKNWGISGATFCKNDLNLVCMTDNILKYIRKADIISVFLGVNDFNRCLPLGKMDDKTNETIYGCLYLIAEHLTTTHKDAFVFFMTPYQARSSWSNNKDYELIDVVKAIKVVGAKYNIPVLDLYHKGQFESVEMELSYNDGLHPSQEFIRNYAAPQIAQFIRDYYQ